MSAEDARKNMEMLPWVRAIKGDPPPCDGIKWGSLALKDDWRNLPADHRARCKRRAKYRLKATVRTRGQWEFPATSGNYCTTHLSMQIQDHEPENRRANRWFDRNGWWRNGVFGKHEIREAG